MKTINDDLLSDELRPYDVVGDPAIYEQVRAYIGLLLKWNSVISLTSVTDPLEIVRFHFGESLFAASAVPIRGGRLADVGSGAGFPGIPLRMLIPVLDLTVIESSARKSAFLSEVVRLLHLDHIEVFHGRMNELDGRRPLFDFITARAFGQFDELLSWSGGHLSKGGKLILWLGDNDASAVSKTRQWEWRDPIRIPCSKRRFLLVGSPIR
jgi:16S rRNA (guanine527-N7)-methyltransferase